MIRRIDLRDSLTPALAGDTHAADRLAGRLLEWAYANLPSLLPQDREAIAAVFAGRLSERNFTRLTNVERSRLAGYLRISLRNARTDHFRVENRRHAREIAYPWVADADGSQEDLSTAAGLIARTDYPEAVVMRRLALGQMWDEVKQMSTLDQRIFELYVAEDLTEQEVADRLGIVVGTVSRHIHSVRRRLRQRLGSDWPW